jgi:hypothetical protein
MDPHLVQRAFQGLSASMRRRILQHYEQVTDDAARAVVTELAEQAARPNPAFDMGKLDKRTNSLRGLHADLSQLWHEHRLMCRAEGNDPDPKAVETDIGRIAGVLARVVQGMEAQVAVDAATEGEAP